MRAVEEKLAKLRDGQGRPDDFILADANDGDTALGVASRGPTRQEPSAPFKPRAALLEPSSAMVAQGVVDIMLVSASNAEWLAGRGVFESSPVTLAVRANDPSDTWRPRGASYPREPSRPFRTVNLERVRPFCDFVLYSLTFNNDLDCDLASQESYARFREQARQLGFRHVLEVFDPNAPCNILSEAVPSFVNDCLVRTLAGVTSLERPVLVMLAYHGRRALEELAVYDPTLVVGVQGGPAGTTRDTYELLAQAVRSGARASLLGRKIELAESPLDLVALMRPVLRGELEPEEAVRAYHAALRERSLGSRRSLEEDQHLSEAVLQHG
jgi:hypothetical protein